MNPVAPLATPLRSRRRRRYAPLLQFAIEPLESRTLLSAFTVGERVITVGSTPVRSTATAKGHILTTLNSGQLGTVEQVGPSDATSEWYLVDWDNYVGTTLTDGWSTGGDPFFIAADTTLSSAPSITSISPTSLPASNSNQLITINGANFVTGATISFTLPEGGTPVLSTASKLTFVSSTQITYQMNNQADAGTWGISVNNPDGQSSPIVPFTVTPVIAPPSISSVTPSSFSASTSNQTLTINGANFTSGATLSFTPPEGGTPISSTAARLTFVSSSQITYQFNSNNDAGTWKVHVNNPDGQSSADASITVNPVISAPSITSISPASMPATTATTTLTINGANFTNGATLSFIPPEGGNPTTSTASKLTFKNAGQITYQFNNNNDAGTWSVRVNNPDGQSSAYATFKVNPVIPAPSISSISPASTPASNNNLTLTINGSNFISGATLSFVPPEGGNPIPSINSRLSFNSSSQITYQFNSSGDAGTWTVRVNNPDGQFSSYTGFKVTPVIPAPSLSSVSPASLPVSTNTQTLTINGSNFTNGATLTFIPPDGTGPIPGSANFVSSSLLTAPFNSNGNGGAWAFHVNNPDGQSSGNLTFTVTSAGNDYPSNLANANLDSFVDQWGFLVRECTSYVAWRINRDLGTINTPYFFDKMTGPNGVKGQFGNADDWDNNARAIGFTVDHTPAVGSIAQWDSLSHVAYVEGVNSDGTVNVSEYNFVAPGIWSERFHVTAESYIHISNAAQQPPPPSNLPIGWIDVANRTVISGWAFDADVGAGSVQARIDIDGVQGTPFLANIPRADLTSGVGSPNHGFSHTTGQLTDGVHSVVLLVQDNVDGLFRGVAAATILAQASSGNRPPIGWIDVANRQTISGWAFDPDLGAASVTARIDIDGVAGALFTASRTRNDLTAVASIGSPNHGFSRTLSTLSNAAHTVTLFVQDNDGTFRQVASKVIAAILPAPSGSGTPLHPVARDPESFFDSTYYLARNPDVAAAVSKGLIASAWVHFQLYGQFEHRRPSALYDEAYYLATYPDIAAAVTSGIFQDGFQHFVYYGFAEGRKGAA